MSTLECLFGTSLQEESVVSLTPYTDRIRIFEEIDEPPVLKESDNMVIKEESDCMVIESASAGGADDSMQKLWCSLLQHFVICFVFGAMHLRDWMTRTLNCLASWFIQ